MATNFPSGLDSLTNPLPTDSLNNPSHSDQHANANDAIEALEAKVGVNSSAVTTSHDYKIAQLETNAVLKTLVDAKGDLLVGTAADTAGRLAVGSTEQRLVVDSAQTTGLKYVSDTTNYAIAAKGDLLVGTAADTLTAVTVGTNGYILTADSAQTAGVKWAAAPATGLSPFLLMGA